MAPRKGKEREVEVVPLVAPPSCGHCGREPPGEDPLRRRRRADPAPLRVAWPDGTEAHYCGSKCFERSRPRRGKKSPKKRWRGLAAGAPGREAA